MRPTVNLVKKLKLKFQGKIDVIKMKMDQNDCPPCKEKAAAAEQADTGADTAGADTAGADTAGGGQTDDTTTTSTDTSSSTVSDSERASSDQAGVIGNFLYNVGKGDLERGMGYGQYMDEPLDDSEKEEYRDAAQTRADQRTRDDYLTVGGKNPNAIGIPNVDAAIEARKEALRAAGIDPEDPGKSGVNFENPKYKEWFSGLSQEQQQAEENIARKFQRDTEERVTRARADQGAGGAGTDTGADTGTGTDTGAGGGGGGAKPAAAAYNEYLRDKGVDPENMAAVRKYIQDNPDDEEFKRLESEEAAEFEGEGTPIGDFGATTQKPPASVPDQPPASPPVVGGTEEEEEEEERPRVPQRPTQQRLAASYNPVSKYGVKLFEARKRFK